jgi:tRNA A-37 threonylcarbamoyl transferase component Bud32
MSSEIETRNVPPALEVESSAPSKGPATMLLSDLPDVATLAKAAVAPPQPERTGSGVDVRALEMIDQRFEVLSALGQGALGSVYKARDRQTQQIVALKLLKPEFASNQTMSERLREKVRLAGKIAHATLCRIYDFHRAGDVAYISMELAEGESLRRAIERVGAIPMRKALHLTLQICAGLKQAHVHGILHGNLKPENVMVDATGNVKILDLGIASSMALPAPRTIARTTGPARVAVDCQPDIYALGLVLYEMFTGKPAFPGENTGSPGGIARQESPVPPHEIEPTVPVSIERAILKCLEREPDKRFPSMAELENALTSSGARAVLASRSEPSTTLANRAAIVGSPAGTSLASPQVRGRAASRKTRLIAGIVLAACVAASVVDGVRWIAISRAARDVPPPSRPAAPAAPDFALEKPGTLKPSAQVEQGSATTGELDPLTPFPLQDEPAIRASAPPSFSAEDLARSPKGPVQRASGGPSNAGDNTYLWVGRFTAEQDAQDSARRIGDEGLPSAVVPRRNPSGEFFVVLAGPLTATQVGDVREQLESLGFANVHAIKNLVLDNRKNP